MTNILIYSGIWILVFLLSFGNMELATTVVIALLVANLFANIQS